MNQISFGQFIRKVRTDKGLSQRTIADQIGVTQGYITKIESGSQLPDYQVFINLANALSISAGQAFSVLAGESPDVRLIPVPEECNEEEIEAGLKFMRFQALERLKRQSSVISEEILTPDNVD